MYPPDVGEWQAAVFLLTAFPTVWRLLGGELVKRSSMAPLGRELRQPSRVWSASEQAAIEWAAYFWNANRAPPRLPYMFTESMFRRWIAALHLRQRVTPQ